MNTGLLFLLSRTGLLDESTLQGAAEGQQLMRCVCPVHEDADNPTGFVLKTDCWFCNTAKCHEEYGGRLEGLVVGLAHRYGGQKLRFREAKAWLSRNASTLKENVFQEWNVFKHGGRTRSSYWDKLFPCKRQSVIEALTIPEPWYFQSRGISPETLRRYDIGKPRPKLMFRQQAGWAIVPLYDLDNPERCVGYTARKTGFSSIGIRWKMSAGFPNDQRLFNYTQARQANERTGQLLLVEGVVDALRCVEAGFTQVVALLGSSLYDEQVEWLSRMKLDDVVVLGDNDQAGEKLAVQVMRRMSGLARTVRQVRLPKPTKDIGDLPTDAARQFLMSSLLSPTLGAA
jgi:5S rRNA maturation endonuclease (ribonuclease M5)